jgi:hypothetical protein
MFGIVRTAVRFFFIGFGVGVLLAPRAGAETRALIREKLDLITQSILEIASFPPAEQDGARGDAATERSASEPTRRARARRSEGSGAGTQS